jgi:hypothetical protein
LSTEGRGTSGAAGRMEVARKEDDMYIGIGTLIVVILLIILLT